MTKITYEDPPRYSHSSFCRFWETFSEKNELYISQISLWEIAKLYALKRIAPERNLEYLLVPIYHHPKYNIVGLNPSVLLKLSNIASKLHKAPAHQLIVASALSIGAVLMTDDQLIKKSKPLEVI